MAANRTFSPVDDTTLYAPEGALLNQMFEEISRANNLSAVFPLGIKDNPSGKAIFIQNAGGPTLYNLTGTLPGAGIYSGVPINLNINLNTAGLTTANVGTLANSTVVLFNMDEIGTGTLHWISSGGANWNPIWAYATGGMATLNGTAGAVMAFSRPVKGTTFTTGVITDDGSNGTVTGTVVTLNTYTYTLFDRYGATAATMQTPSVSHMDFGQITAATLGLITIDGNGAITLNHVWEPNGGSTCP